MDNFKQERKLKEKAEKATPQYKLFENIRDLLASIADSNEAILCELKKLNENPKR